MSKSKKQSGLPGMGNFALASAMQEKRRSGAAGVHADKRDKRARTRAAAKARALKEEL